MNKHEKIDRKTGKVNKGGRPPKFDEEKTTRLALKALKAKFGSLDLAFAALLESGNPKLVLFVFEHAVGKPREKMKSIDDMQKPDTLRIGYPGKMNDEDDDGIEILEAEDIPGETIDIGPKLPPNED